MNWLPAHDVCGPSPGVETPAVFVLHGILGNRGNWRTFARKLARGLSERSGTAWSVVTVDQRHHGDSAGAPGADTVDACADDLARLVASLAARRVVTIGHSFGGKVVLSHAGRHSVGLERVWVLDAPPGPGGPKGPGLDHEVMRVMDALRGIQLPLDRRERIVDELIARGLPRPMALWMTTNLTPGDDGFRFRFDLDGAERLIRDYFAWDGWPVLLAPRSGPAIDVVRAALSDRWDDETVARLAHPPPGVPTRLHTLPDAGHWLHADNPSGLLEMIVGGTVG